MFRRGFPSHIPHILSIKKVYKTMVSLTMINMETIGYSILTVLLIILAFSVFIFVMRERQLKSEMAKILVLKNGLENEIINQKNNHVLQLNDLKNQHLLELQEQEKIIRKDSTVTQRSVIKGKTHEQLAPLLKPFSDKYDLTDARFVGAPLDYLVFKGMSEFNNGNGQYLDLEIVMLDIKTGNSTLSKIEKAVKDAIEKGRVSFDLIRL